MLYSKYVISNRKGFCRSVFQRHVLKVRVSVFVDRFVTVPALNMYPSSAGNRSGGIHPPRDVSAPLWVTWHRAATQRGDGAGLNANLNGSRIVRRNSSSTAVVFAVSAIYNVRDDISAACRRTPSGPQYHKPFLAGCSPPFMRLIEHLTVLRARC